MSQIKDERQITSGRHSFSGQKAGSPAYAIGSKKDDMLTIGLTCPFLCDTSFEPVLDCLRGSRQ